jgi:CubicO group peptidase (beta-lactamase class C family)
MITRSAAALLLALLYCTPCGADDRFAGMDAYIREAMQRWEVPGLAIAVVKDGEVVVARGYGVCEVGGDRPVTENTVFSIASCTKSFTAAALGMLVDEGKVRWDDPVRRHFPQFQVADPYVSDRATLRDLASHRTGLVRGDLLFVVGNLGHDEILRRTRYLEQAAPFRTRFTYNNVMYSVLGEVIAANSGMTWSDFVARRIIEPLDLKSTTVMREQVAPERLAARHRRYGDRVLPFPKPIRDAAVAPASSIHSTAVDMAQWLKWHLAEGLHNDRRLLKAETLRDMHALHQSIPIRWNPEDTNVHQARFVGTGLGWFVRDYRGRKVVQHGGGWGAETALVPEEKLAVVVLSNLDHNLLVQMLIYDVIDACCVGPERAWSKAAKWDFWLKIGAPENYDRVRTEHRALLEKVRVAGTKPALPLDRYAGTYESKLYGTLEVRLEGDHLAVRFGDHAAALEHWQHDMFYGGSVVEQFLDWLVMFHVADGAADRLEIMHVGWKDPDEKQIFRRVPRP